MTKAGAAAPGELPGELDRVFRNLKRESLGVHFMCTFLKVFKFLHIFSH